MGRLYKCPAHPTDRVPEGVVSDGHPAFGIWRPEEAPGCHTSVVNSKYGVREPSPIVPGPQGRRGGVAPWLTARPTAGVLLACCFAGFIAPLLSTMMNLSLVNIGAEFGAGSHSLAYVNTSFLLSSVIFMVPMAKVGDIYGKKKMFLLGVALIAVASLLAAFSPSFWFLIGCRG